MHYLPLGPGGNVQMVSSSRPVSQPLNADQSSTKQCLLPFYMLPVQTAQTFYSMLNDTQRMWPHDNLSFNGLYLHFAQKQVTSSTQLFHRTWSRPSVWLNCSSSSALTWFPAAVMICSPDKVTPASLFFLSYNSSLMFCFTSGPWRLPAHIYWLHASLYSGNQTLLIISFITDVHCVYPTERRGGGVRGG